MKSTLAMCVPAPALALRAKVVQAAPPRLIPQLEQLLREAADAFGVTVDDVRGKVRTKNIASARHVFWWAAREVWGFSYPELGRLLGFDHTTAMSAVARIRREVARGSYIGTVAKQIRGGEEAVLP